MEDDAKSSTKEGRTANIILYFDNCFSLFSIPFAFSWSKRHPVYSHAHPIAHLGGPGYCSMTLMRSTSKEKRN